MGVLDHLEPKNVFHYFEEICAIPHPSYKEQAISDYLVSFARERHLEYYQDALYNVVIIKEATAGYEEAAPIILQGHMDMVCEKDSDCEIDMEREGLRLAVEGDDVCAKGTTLGGDDGIAVAYALAILASEDLCHPRLEFVCTVSEEVGMEGASGIDVSMLQGRKLLNLDSEEEGCFLAGCAGGCSARISLPVSYTTRQGSIVELSLEGLAGGHSGTEIHKGRGNANILLMRILREIADEVEIYLISLEGGRKENAIPRESNARFLVSKEDADRVCKIAEDTARQIRQEFAVTEPNLTVRVDCGGEEEVSCLSRERTQHIICLLQALPNGVTEMSRDIPGLVETSLNLGVMTLQDALTLCYALRSSVGSAKEDLANRMHWIARGLGATFQISGRYPAWEYRKDSVLRGDMVRIYREMFGKEPQIQTLHAGVECGILAGKIAGLDCVSMGPDIHDVHTTGERMSISSVKRMYDFIVELLKQSKNRQE